MGNAAGPGARAVRRGGSGRRRLMEAGAYSAATGVRYCSLFREARRGRAPPSPRGGQRRVHRAPRTAGGSHRRVPPAAAGERRRNREVDGPYTVAADRHKRRPSAVRTRRRRRHKMMGRLPAGRREDTTGLQQRSYYPHQSFAEDAGCRQLSGRKRRHLPLPQQTTEPRITGLCSLCRDLKKC